MIKINNALELTTPLYRIVSFESFVSLIQHDLFYLSNITSFEDPYEFPAQNVTLKEVQEALRKESALTPQNFYISCWSRNDDSDAMWRIYSPNRHGICICTTAQKLVSTISSAYPILVGYLSDVIYKDGDGVIYEAIQDFFSNTLMGDYSIYGQCLLKRSAFKHEEEVRLAVHIPHEFLKEKGILKENDALSLFGIKGIEYIEKVIVDSRAEKWFYDTVRYFSALNGIKCEQSTLYNWTFREQARLM